MTAPSGPIRNLSDNEFQRLVDLTGATGVVSGPVPPILGDPIADRHIHLLAEARGYRQRNDVGVAGLVSVGGLLLERTTATAWQAMQRAARADGIIMSLWSGYRSTSRQRQIFRNKLSARGHGVASVRAGRADAAIEAILTVSSVPGTSRHHTGRAIDVLSPGFGSSTFDQSAAYRWLSRNNFVNAKRHGFVPSYPPAAGLQGPDPESWEYVYVGAEALSSSSRLATLQGFEVRSAEGGSRVVVTGTPIDPDDEYVLFADDRPLVVTFGRCSPGAAPGTFRLSSSTDSEVDLCVVQRWASQERLISCLT